MNAQQAEALAGKMLIVGFGAGTASRGLPREVLQWRKSDGLGGVILFKRNVSEDGGQALLQEISSLGTTPMFLSVDQEGGRVARITAPCVPTVAPMRELAQRHTASEVQALFVAQGQALAALGYNLNYAPVLDVDTNPANPVIGDRSAGDKPETVVKYARACLQGLRRANVLGCGKHFPGHGDTDLDSHHDLPSVRHDWRRLHEVELAPFAEMAHELDLIMTAHVVFDAIDPGVPASLSQKCLREILRVEFGYQGLVISDDLEMQAVAALAPIEELAVRAVYAGCDLLLVCSDVERAARARVALAKALLDDVALRARVQASTSQAQALIRSVSSKESSTFSSTASSTAGSDCP